MWSARAAAVLRFARRSETGRSDACGAVGMSRKKILWSESVRSRVETREGHFLARTSIEARSVASLSVFLEVATKDLPDLIVLDGAAADIAAAPVIDRLRADERTRSVPILALARDGVEAQALRRAGCTEVLDGGADPLRLQEQIASVLGMRLRRYQRFPIVLPVARGRIFHEFLGYSNTVSEGGMGFDTIARVRGGDHHPLRIYRNTEERPISVVGRICGVRPNIDTGVGYAVGVEFVRLGGAERSRLMELFPGGPQASATGD